MKEQEVLMAALDCARDLGYAFMTRRDIAEYADCSESLVSHYLGSMEQVRLEVMKVAVVTEDVTVLAQGIFFKNPEALKASKELRQQALQTIIVQGGAE